VAASTAVSLGPFSVSSDAASGEKHLLAECPLGAIMIVMVLWKLQEWAEARGERFDYSGSVIYGFTLLAMIWTFLLPENSDLADPHGYPWNDRLIKYRQPFKVLYSTCLSSETTKSFLSQPGRTDQLQRNFAVRFI
jgi:hypothetical protein